MCKKKDPKMEYIEIQDLAKLGFKQPKINKKMNIWKQNVVLGPLCKRIFLNCVLKMGSRENICLQTKKSEPMKDDEQVFFNLSFHQKKSFSQDGCSLCTDKREENPPLSSP